MITDQLCIFSDNMAVTSNGNSGIVSVMPFLGKGNAVRVSVAVTEAYPPGAGLSIAVQESLDNGANFTTLASHTVPAATLGRGGSLFSFLLPASLRGDQLRLAYTVTGNPATGRIWAGITEDELSPYEAGQYARAGKVVA